MFNFAKDFKENKTFRFNSLLRCVAKDELHTLPEYFDMDSALEELDFLADTSDRVAAFGVLLDDISSFYDWDEHGFSGLELA